MVFSIFSDCGGVYNMTGENPFHQYHGVIRSPQWPNVYDSNQRCTWTIILPVDQQITLNFTVFHMENGRKSNEYLNIRSPNK